VRSGSGAHIGSTNGYSNGDSDRYAGVALYRGGSSSPNPASSTGCSHSDGNSVADNGGHTISYFTAIDA
jgi:hypothetical protein